MAERELISRIAARLEPSPIRRMAPYLARPEVISLAGGVPDPATFPAAEIEQALRSALAADPSAVLQYGRTRGAPRLLAALAARLGGIGLRIGEEQVFVTAGSQQALDLLGRLLLDPGDTVVVERPTYAGALAAFAAAGAQVRALATGGSDPDPEEVGRAVRRAAARGSIAKVLYLLPNFQNPAGTTLSLAARASLLAAAAAHRLVVIEDDPYRELWFDAPPPPPVASLGGEAPVVYLGSLSKVLAPGLRLGFIAAPAALCGQLERLKESADLCTSTVSQAIALELLTRGVVDDRLDGVRSLYRRRRDAMIDALARHLPEGVSFTRPGGGFFTWLEAPGVDIEALLARALAADLAFVAGASFHAEEGGEHTLRLAYSKEPEERIGEGVRLLGRLLRA